MRQELLKMKITRERVKMMSKNTDTEMPVRSSVSDYRPDLWIDKSLTEAKTSHEWFDSDDYRKVKDETKWKDWKNENLIHLQDVLLDRYTKEGFWLLALRRQDKLPRDKKWYRLDRGETTDWTLIGGNLGVACGSRSEGLAVLDLEYKEVPKEIQRLAKETLTAATRRGWHLYFRSEGEEIPKRQDLKEKCGECEFRYDNQYVVVPLSVVRHEKLEWVYQYSDWKKPILPLRKLLDTM